MNKQFFPYLMAGYPSEPAFADVLQATLPFADTVEIGIPFSDPVADGPVIQKASRRALDSGFKLESVFRTLQAARIKIPAAIMTYANPVLFYGRDAFFRACRQSGARCVILPDIPFEECTEWKHHAGECGLQWISFVSLQTSDERLSAIARSADGFLYLLSLTGVTGSAIHSADAVRRKAQQIRGYTSTPIALGFGIKSPSDAIPFLTDVDAFIVGSRIVELVAAGAPLEPYYREFRAILRGES